MTEALTQNYWISPRAVVITRNAMGLKDYIQCSATVAAVIMCFMRDIDGLGYDAGHNYRRWPLVTAPVYFNNSNRRYVYVAIPRSSDVGTHAILAFPEQRIDIYGMTEPAAGQEHGDQVGNPNYYYIFLQGILSPSVSVGGADQLREWEHEIDYGTLSTDQAMAEKEDTWWRYLVDEDKIEFLKTITTATIERLRVTKELIAEGVADFLSDVNISGYLKASGGALIEKLLIARNAVMDNIQSSNFSGDSMADSGWMITNNYRGSSRAVFDYLYVRKKLIAEELELKKKSVSAGDQIFSCAANYINRVEYLHVAYDVNGNVDESESYDLLGYETVKVPWLLRKTPLLLRRVTGIFARTRRVRTMLTDEGLSECNCVRCYFLAKDDDREVENWWRVGDLARCQTMNLLSGSSVQRDGYERSKVGNIYWWRKVVGVSKNKGTARIDGDGREISNGTYDPNGGPVTLDDGKEYHYFDVAYSSNAQEEMLIADTGSDLPAAGDTAVQFGNVTDPDRMNLMMFELNGSGNTDAPCMKIYRGLYTFDMNRCWWGGNPRKMMLSPSKGYEFYGPSFKFTQEYGIERIPVNRGFWTDVPFEHDDFYGTEDYIERSYTDDDETEGGDTTRADGTHGTDYVRKCYNSDIVSHQGSLWRCSFAEGAHWVHNVGTAAEPVWQYDAQGPLPGADMTMWERRENYTSEEPNEGSHVWEKQVSAGGEGRDGNTPLQAFRWYKEGLVPTAPTDRTDDVPEAVDYLNQADKASPATSWSATAPNRPGNEEWMLWMTQSVRRVSQEGTVTRDAWSQPVCISGPKGDAGEDAKEREWIYIGKTQETTFGTQSDPHPKDITTDSEGQTHTAAEVQTIEDFVPQGWSDNAIATDDTTNLFVYASWRDWDKQNKVWKPFNRPIIWSNWGHQGIDGDGVQYIYKLFDHELTEQERTNTQRPTNARMNANGEWMPSSDNPTSVNYGWSDDMLSPTSSLPYSYCAVIKKTGGHWATDGNGNGVFGKLGLWSVYSESGLVSDLDNEMDAFGTDINGIVVTPQVLTTHVSLYYGITKQIITGITATVYRADTNNVISDANVVEANISGVNTDEGTVAVNIKQQDSVALTYDIYVDITTTCAIGTRSARFTLKHVSSGAPGVSPTIYQLLPSATSVVFAVDSSGTEYVQSSQQVTCGYTSTIGNAMTPHPNEVSTGSYNIYYRKSSSASYTKLATAGVTVYPTDSFVEFILCTNTAATVAAASVTNLVDRETVPVLKDGKKGADGVGDVIKVTIIRNNLNESDWATYCTIGHLEAWQFTVVNADGTNSNIETKDARNGCKTDDLFLVVGTAKDTGNGHTATYRCTNDSGNLQGRCIAHQIAYAGEPGSDGTNGADGADGYGLTVTPPYAIFEQTYNSSSDSLSLDLSTYTGVISVTKGNEVQQIKVTNKIHSHCTSDIPVAGKTGTSVTFGFETVDSSYKDGYLLLNVATTDGKLSQDVKVPFYLNKIGSFEREVKNGIETVRASLSNYQPKGNYVESSTFTTYQETSARQWQSKLNETVSTINPGGGKNLFGFTKCHFENSIPFVQGYGIVADNASYNRVYQLGFNGRSGYYTVSCEIMANRNKEVQLQICDVDATGGINIETGTSAMFNGKAIVKATTQWKRVVAVFNIPSDNEHISGSYNGFFDVQLESSGDVVYIRRLMIEYGTSASAFSVCEEDAASKILSTLVDENGWDHHLVAKVADSDALTGLDTYRANIGDMAGTNALFYKEGTITLASGSVYTLSFWAKSSVNGIALTAYLHPNIIGNYIYVDVLKEDGVMTEGVLSDGHTKISLLTEWKRYYVHVYVVNSGSGKSCLLRYDKDNSRVQSGNVFIAGVRLDQGYITENQSKDYQTMMQQTARSIDFAVLKNSMEMTGIHLYTESQTSPNSYDEISKGVFDATADNFNIKNSSGVITFSVDANGNIIGAGNARFNGNITATGGSIGGFTIDSDRLYNSDWGAGIDISTNDGRSVRIGKNAVGTIDTTENAILRAENTRAGKVYNTALYLNAKNATYNYAFYGNGNGVLNGLMFGYKAQIVEFTTGGEETKYMYLKTGSVFFIRCTQTSGNKVVKLPTLSEVRLCLGISDTTTQFGICLDVVNESRHSNIYIGFAENVTDYDNGYPCRFSDETTIYTGGASRWQIQSHQYKRVLLCYTTSVYGYRGYVME